MTSAEYAEPPPRAALGRRLSTFFYRHPRVGLAVLLARPARLAGRRLPRLAVRAPARLVVGHEPVHVRGRARLHARQLPPDLRGGRLPRGGVADDQDGRARHGRRRGARVSDRVLHGAGRVAADAQPARRRGADAAVGELPGQGLRVADDPLRLGRRSTGRSTRSASRSTATRRSASGSSSRTCGCRS